MEFLEALNIFVPRAETNIVMFSALQLRYQNILIYSTQIYLNTINTHHCWTKTIRWWLLYYSCFFFFHFHFIASFRFVLYYLVCWYVCLFVVHYIIHMYIMLFCYERNMCVCVRVDLFYIMFYWYVLCMRPYRVSRVCVCVLAVR